MFRTRVIIDTQSKVSETAAPTLNPIKKCPLTQISKRSKIHTRYKTTCHPNLNIKKYKVGKKTTWIPQFESDLKSNQN